jgi:hypothetical protein
MTDGTHNRPPSPGTSATDASTAKEASTVNTCCGGPAPAGTSACCARDADVKSGGSAGCGCGSAKPAPAGKSGCCE